MRNAKRLDNFYLTLKNIHQENFPDWRFGQFICNFIHWCKKDIFYLEEDSFITIVYEYVKEMNGIRGIKTENADVKNETGNDLDYEQGLKDMMECQRKIYKMSEDDIYKCFNLDDEDNPEEIWKLEPDAILKKVEDWEKMKDFHVEDEVVHNMKIHGKGVITKVNKHDYNVLWNDGITGYYTENDLKKTGKKIYVGQILRELSKK